MSTQKLHDALLNWFEHNKAELPWRQTNDPYAIWLSEIMLQQTQVTTVIPYYNRFLLQFPTVNVLAAADQHTVLKAWEGLGYYSRARNLHRTAQIVAQEYNGQFPEAVNELLKLPGIGRYTAGAIASIAFNGDAAVLDGNVIRVFTRLFDIDADVTLTATKNKLWQQAAQLVPSGQAGAWNEALMELGRVICSPKAPACELCPLVTHCQAYKKGVQLQRPVKPPRKKTPHYDVTAAVIEQPAGKILIAQRPVDGMLGGLWEFPGGKREEGESLVECLQREITEELGIKIEVGSQITTVKHAYTHFRITLYAYRCIVLEGEPQAIECADWRWVTLEELEQYAFPVTDQKIIAALRDGGGQLALEF